MGDFVGVNEDFSHFSTSLSANSLLVHGTLLRQNRGTLGPGITERALLRRNQRKKNYLPVVPVGLQRRLRTTGTAQSSRNSDKEVRV